MIFYYHNSQELLEAKHTVCVVIYCALSDENWCDPFSCVQTASLALAVHTLRAVISFPTLLLFFRLPVKHVLFAPARSDLVDLVFILRLLLPGTHLLINDADFLPAAAVVALSPGARNSMPLE